MTKQWNLARGISEELKGQFQELDPVVLQLLVNRGIVRVSSLSWMERAEPTTNRVSSAERGSIDPAKRDLQNDIQKDLEAIHEFLKPDWQSQIHDPFLFRDMEKAVSRIYKALETQEKVVIFGDYDADGVTGSTILYQTLQRLGFKNLEVYIPHREHEGYGLNEAAMRQLIEGGAKLIITVDLGLSNAQEIEVANAAGVDVIVVDHHDFVSPPYQGGARGGGLPPALAIIHADLPGEPYPFKELCGAGTAFKLAQALLRHSMEETEAFEKWLLDLVAIGTIGDMVPLTGENRVLAQYGLMVLNKTQNLGLRALLEVAGLCTRTPPLSRRGNWGINSWNVAWQIVPRINAASRLSHAREALLLLLAEDEKEAKQLADHLNTINQERQRIADQIYKEVLELMSLDPPLAPPLVRGEKGEHLLIAYNPEWPLGVVGLVASRLAKEYQRPVILLTDARGQVAGSGRSIPGFDIIQALAEVSETLLKFGGHPAACGLQMAYEQREDFVESFTKVVNKRLAGKDLTPSLDIDVEIEYEQISEVLVEKIAQFEPFGTGNPKPRLMTRKLEVEDVRIVGSQGNHLKLRLTNSGHKPPVHPLAPAGEPPLYKEGEGKQAIGFGQADKWRDRLKVGDTIDLVYELRLNEWNGQKEVEMKIVDLRKSYG